jgi:hypothetical protein
MFFSQMGVSCIPLLLEPLLSLLLGPKRDQDGQTSSDQRDNSRADRVECGHDIGPVRSRI